MQNFRCYNEATLEFPSRGILVTGPNGSGKTNLLESIHYLSCGKSPITSTEKEMIRFESDFFFARALCEIQNHEHTISIGMERSNEKKALVDGVQLERISDLYRYLKAIYFSPSDINMVSGPGGDRRLVFNQAISQYSFGYLENYRVFQRVLKQRNALLKTSFDPQEKESWDRQFARAASDLVQMRLDYLKEFMPRYVSAYRSISGNAETPSMVYHPKFEIDSTMSVHDAYLQRMQAIQEKEIEYGHTMVGPHRDDFVFYLDGHPARAYASQGQRRSISIAVRLAQAELIREATGETPVMMFDDVLAELDERRARHLIEMLNPEHQIFIATPNPGDYRHFAFTQLDVTSLHRAVEAPVEDRDV